MTIQIKYFYDTQLYNTVEDAVSARASRLSVLNSNQQINSYMAIKHITMVSENTFFIPEEKLTNDEALNVSDTEWYMCVSLTTGTNEHILGSQVPSRISSYKSEYINCLNLEQILEETKTTKQVDGEENISIEQQVVEAL